MVLTTSSVANTKGLLETTCKPSHVAQVDPIKNWNQPVSGHMHQFFCNTSTAYNSTTASLQAGGTTSNVKGMQWAVWVPLMLDAAGNPVTPISMSYRFDNVGPGNVTVPPDGLDFIMGNAANTNPNATAGLWACTGVANTPQMTIPTSCPAGAVGKHVAIYPHHGCWNGTQMGPGLGRGDGPADAFSHINGTQDCPTGIRQPRPSIVFKYPLSAHHLSSDAPGQLGGTTMHVDDVVVSGTDVFGRDFITQVVNQCLNVVPDDGIRNTGFTCRVNSTGQVIRNSDNAVVFG